MQKKEEEKIEEIFALITLHYYYYIFLFLSHLD